MNFDTSAYCHKSEYIISVNRIAAFGKFKFQSFQILIDDKHILFGGDLFLCCLQIISFGTAINDLIMRVIVPSLLFEVFIQNIVDIQCLICNLLIKLCHIFEAQTLDKTHHRSFVIFHLPVFELPFQCLFGEIVLACYHLLKCLTYLGAGFGSRHDVQPVLLRSLGIRRHDFHLITAVQFLL